MKTAPFTNTEVYPLQANTQACPRLKKKKLCSLCCCFLSFFFFFVRLVLDTKHIYEKEGWVIQACKRVFESTSFQIIDSTIVQDVMNRLIK